MRGLRYDRILASTALALILAAPAGIALAANDAPAALDAAVPMPNEPALAPPTAADIAVQPTETTGTITAPSPDVAIAPPPAPAAAVSEPAPPAAAVAAETAAPDPFASLDPADRPIAEKMRDLLAAKVDKIFGNNKKERTAVETFYQNRNMAPLWIEKGVESARATAAIARTQERERRRTRCRTTTRFRTFAGRHTRRPRRVGIEADRDAADLCPPRAGRPVPLFAHQPEHRGAAAAAGHGRGFDQGRGRRRRRQGARRVLANEQRIQVAQGEARRTAQQGRRQRRP